VSGEPLICRIRRCTAPARWIVTVTGHPNGSPPPSAYCHEHAEERSKLLWDESPRPYSSRAEGPYTPRDLRRALGPSLAADHVESKRQQIAELEAAAAARLTATDPEPDVDAIVRDALGRQWIRAHENSSGWLQLAHLDGDYESWTKVAGNYGPVTLERGRDGA
jgi:hypothetical protein